MLPGLILTSFVGCVVGMALSVPMLLAGLVPTARATGLKTATVWVATLLIGYAVSLGLVAYALAQSTYDYGIGPDSHLSATTIKDIRSNRDAVIQELWFRTALYGFAPKPQCVSAQAQACRLADKIEQAEFEPWSVGAWEALHASSMCAGLWATVPVLLTLRVQSWLRRRQKLNEIPDSRSND